MGEYARHAGWGTGLVDNENVVRELACAALNIGRSSGEQGGEMKGKVR